VSGPAPLADALAPLRADPGHAAVLLDVDGVLAPIVRHAEDASVPEATRTLLIEVAARYGCVACVSGRRAQDARRIVSLGSIAYVGSHGTELLPPGGVEPQLDREVAAWARRVQEFLRETDTRELRRHRVRLEDKAVIAAYHWRGARDEAQARELVEAVAARAQERGLQTHWGRKVLEVRPPVTISKGLGIRRLLADRERDIHAAVYAGDDQTDLDAFRALVELVEEGRLRHAVRVGVGSDEGPQAIRDEADVVVDGPDGVRALLRALL
jgi:trehalose 6-phosphate phosphatase